MEVVSQAKTSPSPALQQEYNPQTSSDSLVLSSLSDDAAVVDLKSGTGIALTAQQIVDKINSLLAKQLPEGLASLSPEQTTPEATADFIVSNATALFSSYQKQNPDLEDEELVEQFMQELRSGIESGYSDAYDTLEGLGAFEFEGVREGVEQTRILIEEKLVKFEQELRKSLGITELGITEQQDDTASEYPLPVPNEAQAFAGARLDTYL